MPPDTPCVLAFDTSAAHCAAALLSDNTVIAERCEEMAKGQAERLLPLIEDLLRDNGLAMSDLTALGVGVGPGNFTGIRISVATARGLAMSLGIPAVGVSTLVANAEGLATPCLSILDARRDMVYVQLVGTDESPHLLPRSELPRALRDQAVATVVGYDAEPIAEALACPATRPAFPVAVAIARIAARKAGPNLLRPAPLYLRDPDAAPSSILPPAMLP